jgi:6-phosphogluconolactonase
MNATFAGNPSRMRTIQTTSLLAMAGVLAGASVLMPLHGSTQGMPPPAYKAGEKPTFVYVGTHTDKGKGIYLFRLQTEGLEVSQNITLVPLGLAADTPNPTHFAIDFTKRLLFTVNEIEQFEGKTTGAVSAFAIDSASGKLTALNQRPSAGARPCQIALAHESKHVLVANCGSGTIAVLPLTPDGRIGDASATVNASAKCLALDPASRFAYVCDQEGDRVLVARFDAQKGTLSAPEPAARLKTGAGPRRLAFRPDGKFAYVVNERTSTITVFQPDATSGALAELQTVSTLPEYYDGPNRAVEIGVHPNGKYLYVSNTGHNSVVLFTIDGAKGTLTYVEEQGTGGKNPVHFGIEPSAKHLAIANQDTDQLLASRIDAGNGRLKPSGVFAVAPSPAFVMFLPPPE